MMKKCMLLLFLLIGIFQSFAFSSVEANASNGVHYQTYTEDHEGILIPTQDAYLAVQVINRFGSYTLDKPQDLFLKDHFLYIADTGNNRILVINTDDLSVIAITDASMIRPTGLFVGDDLTLYVADPEAQKIFVFNASGVLEQTFERPDSILFGTKTLFRPSKIIVDKRNNLYIVGDGNYGGLIQLNQNGEYLGYFGANKSNITLRQKLIKSIFSEEIVSQYFSVVPLTPSNVSIDSEGMIYTVTRGTETEAIRKLNIAGSNKLTETRTTSLTFTDVTSGPIGNIYATTDEGLIYEYDAEGNLIFVFGGKDVRSLYQGLFNTPAAIAVDSNYNLFVLDSVKSEVHLMIPTEFSSLVHTALSLYQEGRYVLSQEPWEKVLQYDYKFDMAHKGIGQSLYKQKLFAEALEKFEMVDYQTGYSNAFWEIRNIWLTTHLNTVLIFIAALFGISYVFNRYFKSKYQLLVSPIRSKIKSTQFMKESRFALSVFHNPSNVMQEIQYDRGISLGGAMVLYGLLFIVRILSLTYTGPLFNQSGSNVVSIVNEMVQFFGPLLLLIVANYLVATINDGQGKFLQVVKAVSVSLMPLLLFMGLNILLSHVLTLNEAFIYRLVNGLGYGISLVFLFVMIKDLHNYTIKKALLNVLLTVFTFVIFLVAILLLNRVWGEIAEFITQLTKEVFNRG
jgi:DNA-binding beta-propeller fold protein YncE